jgi:hypothetical protein
MHQNLRFEAGLASYTTFFSAFLCGLKKNLGVFSVLCIKTFALRQDWHPILHFFSVLKRDSIKNCPRKHPYPSSLWANRRSPYGARGNPNSSPCFTFPPFHLSTLPPFHLSTLPLFHQPQDTKTILLRPILLPLSLPVSHSSASPIPPVSLPNAISEAYGWQTGGTSEARKEAERLNYAESH